MLSKFPNKTLKVGAIVSLSPETTWSKGEFNPIGVRGKITKSEKREYDNNHIDVKWENGCSNTYRWEHYDLIAEGEPGFLATE